ncbi:hypothetical protein ACH5RR_007391 [Cinchona calisaya]|uniref:BHLH domain-containing protein n=1 Tax=Cinchona calisaya TaxID=153742 RepID=A0ABD3ART6_9GENT
MYGDSQASSSSHDDNSNSILFPVSSNAREEEAALFAKSREELFFMDSVNKQYSTNQNSSGLLRFRSAPSSLLENFSEGVLETGKNCGPNQGLTSRFSSSDYGYAAAALNSQLPPQYPRSSVTTQVNGGGYRGLSSIGMDHQVQTKIMGSNLMRQNSSPAELFSHLSSQSGYAALRGVGGLSPSSTRLKGPMNFSSGIPSTLGTLSRISEIDNETGINGGPDDEKLGNRNGDTTQFYGSGFPFGSWNNSSKFAENFTGLKREIDSDQTLFAESQGGEPKIRTQVLSHHLSLPKTSAEIAAMEKLLQFQDTVPCKIRAKRGCATHPRSIAERVRRTRISERMRKLQELVPNMDKQTNTADMLDLAVDYIKDLQEQYKTLSEIRANCKCSAMQKPVPDQMV